MSDYYATARSSYYKVKSKKKFKKFCQEHQLEFIESDSDKGKVGFLVQTDFGTIPNGRVNSKGNYVEIDFEEELSKHLAAGEVAVVVEAGNEKLKYVAGYAFAVNSKGRTVVVSTDDIYNKAEKMFKTKTITRAEY